MTDWTPRMLRVLDEEWRKGTLTTEIGQMLGVTKNVVIGKARRLGFEARKSPIKRSSSMPASLRRTPRLQIKIEQAKHQRKVAAANGHDRPLNISPGFEARLPVGKRRCEWRDGERETGFTQCPDKALVGKPWCPRHHAVATVPRRSRSEEIPEQAPGD